MSNLFLHKSTAIADSNLEKYVAFVLEQDAVDCGTAILQFLEKTEEMTQPMPPYMEDYIKRASILGDVCPVNIEDLLDLREV